MDLITKILLFVLIGVAYFVGCDGQFGHGTKVVGLDSMNSKTLVRW